jgi:hypothetical protein
MKKLAFLLFTSILFVGCGLEVKQKEKKEPVHTVIVKDIGNFVTKEKITYDPSGIVIFEDLQGRTFHVHISNCTIVDVEIQPQPPQEPAPNPPAETPENNTENNPGK